MKKRVSQFAAGLTLKKRGAVAKQQTRTIWNRVPGRIAGVNPVCPTYLYHISEGKSIA